MPTKTRRHLAILRHGSGALRGQPIAMTRTMVLTLVGLCLLIGAIDRAHADRFPVEPVLRIEAEMHTAPIWALDFSADRKLLATGSDDKTVRLWSIPDGRLLRTLRMPIDSGFGGEVQALALSPDGTIVAAGGYDAANSVEMRGYVTLFDTRTGFILRRLGPLAAPVHVLRFSSDGAMLVVGIGGANGIRVWSTHDGKLLLSDSGRGALDGTDAADFAADGRLATASSDGYVRLYGARLRLAAKVPLQGGKVPHSLAFSPDGQQIAIGYLDSAVDVLAAASLKTLFSETAPQPGSGNLGAVAWSADGRTLFASGTFSSAGVNPIFAWPDQGRGPREVAYSAPNTVQDIRAYGRGGFAFAEGPSIDLVDDAGKLLMFKGAVTADLRNSVGGAFLVSRDARQVRFGMRNHGADPWTFDVASLNLRPSPMEATGLNAANLDGLEVDDWQNTSTPKVGGRALAIDRGDRSRSLAVLPDASGFLLGTNYVLARFDALGKKVWETSSPGTVWGVNLSSDGRVVVSANDDGTIRWHRASDGVELLALFVHAIDKRWVAWTPSGYYAASPGGEDLIGWHLNHGLDQAPDFFPASRFHDRFYRPDIVQAVLTTLDENIAIERANAAAHRREDSQPLAQRLPPVIALKTAPGTSFSSTHVTLDYELRSPSGLPVQAIDVLIDGRPASDARGFERVNAGFPLGAGQIEVTLPERNISVALIARAAGGLASEAAGVDLVWAGAPASAGADVLKPKLYGLFIGISAYQDPDLRLGLAAKDARDFAAALNAQSGRLYGGVETKVLTDGQATRADILDGLDWLQKEVTSRDIGVIFLAGHGMTDEAQDYWFLPDDAKLDRLRATAVAQEDIQRTLKRLPGKALLFLDTCHSGQLLAAPGTKSRGVADITAVVNELTSAENGVVAFASSTGREVSMENEEWGNGAFTKALIEGLGGKADLLRNGAITLSELDAYVVNRVKDLTGGAQHAVMLRPATVSDYPIALVNN